MRPNGWHRAIDAVQMPDSSPVAILIEDEQQIRRFVRAALETEGWNVHECGTLAQGLKDAGTRKPDLVVLDLGLPDGDGVEFLRNFRSWSQTPVIVLSARVGEHDKIEALDIGADDYLTKPFGVGELLARVRAACRRRRASGNSSAIFQFGDVQIDMDARTVKKRDVAVHLTPIEYRLLTLLAANEGKVLTHRQILSEVWGPTHAKDGHYLRVYMGQLREKLEDEPARPQHILTETAVGYRLLQDAASPAREQDEAAKR
jgi:two-component system, OmpR family, KDP operon response regulator KdpE